MKGDPAIIRTLNAVLTNELTAVNQYFLHARMFESWGLTPPRQRDLRRIDRRDEARRHADQAHPLPGRPAQSAGPAQAQGRRRRRSNAWAPTCSWKSTAAPPPVAAVTQCEAARDYVSRDLLIEILADTEEHIDFLENQHKLIELLGAQNYLQSAMSEIVTDTAATGN